MPLIVHTVPAFTDNYIWLFHQQGDNQAFVVDPGDATPVLDALKQMNLSLAGILITHHHPDHVGGIPQLLEHYQVPIYAPEGIQHATSVMKEGDTIHLANATFDVLEVPGHTLDHIVYFNADEPLVFCGDTLFANGCGRLFEGTAEQMWHSLSKLAALPKETKVYCAHEYTKANTNFALTVEPQNLELQKRAKDVDKLRSEDKPTIPSTLAMELATNPFIRANKASIQEAAASHGQDTVTSATEAFAEIRRWKDNF